MPWIKSLESRPVCSSFFAITIKLNQLDQFVSRSSAAEKAFRCCPNLMIRFKNVIHIAIKSPYRRCVFCLSVCSVGYSAACSAYCVQHRCSGMFHHEPFSPWNRFKSGFKAIRLPNKGAQKLGISFVRLWKHNHHLRFGDELIQLNKLWLKN